MEIREGKSRVKLYRTDKYRNYSQYPLRERTYDPN